MRHRVQAALRAPPVRQVVPRADHVDGPATVTTLQEQKQPDLPQSVRRGDQRRLADAAPADDHVHAAQRLALPVVWPQRRLLHALRTLTMSRHIPCVLLNVVLLGSNTGEAAQRIAVVSGTQRIRSQSLGRRLTGRGHAGQRDQSDFEHA